MRNKKSYQNFKGKVNECLGYLLIDHFNKVFIEKWKKKLIFWQLFLFPIKVFGEITFYHPKLYPRLYIAR